MIDGAWGLPASKHPEALKLSEKIKVMKPKMARAQTAWDLWMGNFQVQVDDRLRSTQKDSIWWLVTGT